MLDIPSPAHLKVDLGTAMDCQVPHTLGLLSQQMAWHFPSKTFGTFFGLVQDASLQNQYSPEACNREIFVEDELIDSD